MYIANHIKSFRIQWTEIALHHYERQSRSKWRITLDYACGARMVLENQPDDMIQCLVLGAYNSGRTLVLEDRTLSISAPDRPRESYRDLQDLLVD